MEIGIAYLGCPEDAGPLAREAEEAGVDAFTCGEAEHAAFGCCVAALLSTRRIVVGTNIAIAFARTPMAAAMEAHGLVSLGPGRTFYGIGSQIKQVVERRFGAEWTPPLGRMSEYGAIMRRAFRALRGEDVEPFEGLFYRVSQFRFFGTPEPDLAPLELHLAATGPKMTALAAAEFDAMLGHGVATPKYLREHIKPAIGSLYLTSAAMTSIDDDVSAARERARWALAFYATTPAYEPALACEGFADLPARLRKALREEGREKLPSLVSDDVLDRFVLIGRREEVAERLEAWDGLVDRVMLGGIGIGATRSEIVENNRELIKTARLWKERSG